MVPLTIEPDEASSLHLSGSLSILHQQHLYQPQPQKRTMVGDSVF